MDDRETIQQRERGRATVRALYLSQLHEIGRRRTEALQEAEAQLDRLARLLPSASDAGLTLSEIAQVVQVSRPTLYQLRARYGSSYDLRLALLQTIANYGRARTSELENLMKGDADRIPDTLKEMLTDGLLAHDFNEDSSDPAMEWELTQSGFDTLERWNFDELVFDDEVVK